MVDGTVDGAEMETELEGKREGRREEKRKWNGSRDGGWNGDGDGVGRENWRRSRKGIVIRIKRGTGETELGDRTGRQNRETEPVEGIGRGRRKELRP